MGFSLTLKEDAERVAERFEAFYAGEVIDRALVSMTVRRKDAPASASSDPAVSAEPSYSSFKERWLDVDRRAEAMARHFERYAYMGEALPIAFPNMGPEIFSACCGCGYEFGENTTWSTPAIEDWDRDAGKVRFNPEHPLWKVQIRFIKALIERGKGKYIVGLTDFHPGGDHLAALRDPSNLAMDLLDNPRQVKAMLKASQPEYYQAYDQQYELISAAGMPATSWLPAIAFGKYYIPSCDFSALISSAQFDEFFLPGLIEECEFYDRAVYHLDGPGAIRHLDSIMSIPGVHAIQWVPGAGHEELAQWIPLLKRIRAGGKSVLVYCTVKELDLVFENLRPEGVWIQPNGVADEETAAYVLRRVEKWR